MESLLSLYIHIPFCFAKCGYCSFYSQTADAYSIENYLSAIEREASLLNSIWKGHIPLRTLYIGGGTPTVLSSEHWKRIFCLLERYFDRSLLEEFTVEANPCSLTSDHILTWRIGGVTRVSVGIQSLINKELQWLGRVHDADQALNALQELLDSGFDVSADLIFGYPLQTLRTWHSSLQQILRLGVQHVSIYQLTLEEDTPLGKKKILLPDGYPFYRFAQWYLPKKGLHQYEVASFACPGKESMHNSAYWLQQNVLALGPSAWGYLNGFRYRNVSMLEEYCASLQSGSPTPIADAENLSLRARGIEAAILALRTRTGIQKKKYIERFGVALWEDILSCLSVMPEHFYVQDEEHIHLTANGIRVGNSIWADLLELSDE